MLSRTKLANTWQWTKYKGVKVNQTYSSVEVQQPLANVESTIEMKFR